MSKRKNPSGNNTLEKKVNLREVKGSNKATPWWPVVAAVPVSYTHLDVYKRQVMIYLMCCR